MAHLIASAVAALKLLERRCPNCHHRQLVPRSQRDETVKCKKCGEAIPPKH